MTLERNEALLNAMDQLEERVELASTRILHSLEQEYERLLLKHSPKEMAESTGLSEAAFLPPDGDLSFKPTIRFPSVIRIGSLINQAFKQPAPWFVELFNSQHIAVAGEAANDVVDNVITRLIAAVEPDLMQWTLVDPVSLGSQFANFGCLRSEPVLTESADIHCRLKWVKLQVVEVIQNCLTTNFRNLDDFNASQQITSCRRAHQVVIYKNFPQGLSREGLALLQSLIASSVSKAGIHVVLTIDEPDLLDELLDTTINMQLLHFPKWVKNWRCQPDSAISPATKKSILDAANTWLENRPAVSWADVGFSMQGDGHPHAHCGVSIPIGVAINGQVVSLQLGFDSVAAHTLIAGGTGSGKSILLHNILLNTASRYTPSEVTMYLLDFKEGTELTCYKELPHVRVLSLDASRRFGVEMLEHVQAEITKRGDLFKSAGVASLSDYVNVTGGELPRIMVVLDEFQVLLANDSLGTKAAALLDDLARRGRAFGVHLILATQSLAEVNVKTSTINNIAIRIGLRMHEHDAMRVFSTSNTAPAKLNTVGAAILNTMHGQQASNNIQMQVPLVTREEREQRLAKLSAKFSKVKDRFIKKASGIPAEFRSANITFKENIIVGEGEYISSYNSAVGFLFNELPAQNLLIIGNDPSQVIASTLLISFQLLTKMRAYVICVDHYSGVSSGNFLTLQTPFPDHFRVVQPEALPHVLDDVIAELQRRKSEPDNAAEVIVLLLTEATASTALSSRAIGGAPSSRALETLIKEGSSYRIHVILTASSSASLHSIFNSPTELINLFAHKLIHSTDKILPEVVLNPHQAMLVQGNLLLPIRVFEQNAVNFVNSQKSFEVVYVE